MTHIQQPQAFKEHAKQVVFAQGADAAFDMLVREGWILPAGKDDLCPPGFRIFATATWERRVLIKDEDESLWALELK